MVSERWAAIVGAQSADVHKTRKTRAARNLGVTLYDIIFVFIVSCDVVGGFSFILSMNCEGLFCNLYLYLLKVNIKNEKKHP